MLAEDADEAWAEAVVRQDRPDIPYKRNCPIWRALLAYVRVEATKRPLHKTFSRPHGTSDPNVTKYDGAQGSPYSKHGFMLFYEAVILRHSRGAPLSISSDRDSRFMGRFFQFYSATQPGGFFFEIIQRENGYQGYGAPNAPFRIAAQKRGPRPAAVPRR